MYNMYNTWALFAGFLFCILIRCSYFVVDYYLLGKNIFYDSLEPHRKLYVQKNLVKSACLALMLPPALIVLVYPIWYYDNWNTELIQYFAVLYGSNDLTGLIVVDNLPSTTKIHHFVSSFLVLTALYMDFQSSEIAQSLLVYTFFAASAYIVNFQLAVRWLFKRGECNWLRYFAGTVYTVSCTLSWSWQLWWVYNVDLYWYHLLYILLMLWIVRDDIILMRWLTSI